MTPAVVAGEVQARAIAQATQQITEALVAFARGRQATIIPALTRSLQESFVDRTPDEISKLIVKETAREREFLRRQAARIRRDLPKVLAEADADDRRAAMDRLMAREQRYMAQREQAMTARAYSAVDSMDLQEASPEGAYWMLGGPVHQHTAGCVAMANRFWPWAVLRDVIHPPVHPGCPCTLISLNEAVTRGFMDADQLPDVRDALVRARRNLALEEALNETYPAWALAEEMAIAEAEAAFLHRGEAPHPHAILRYAKGLVKGGQFMPRLGGHSDRTKTKRLLPHVPHPPKLGAGRTLGTRNVFLHGHRTAIPEHRSFSRVVGGHHYTSPPGSTNVYRDGELVSTPGTPAVHPDLGRARLGDKKGRLAPAGRKTPAPVRDAEAARAQASGRRVEAAMRTAKKDVSPVREGQSAHDAHAALRAGGFKPDEAGSKQTQNLLTVPYEHGDGHELSVTYDRETSKVTKATWKPGEPSNTAAFRKKLGLDQPKAPEKKAEEGELPKEPAAKAEKAAQKPPEPKEDRTLGTGDERWARQLDRAVSGDPHAQWDMAAEADARGWGSDFAKQLKQTAGADAVRRWRDGSKWPNGVVPRGDPPPRYALEHVPVDGSGPTVGVALHEDVAGGRADVGRHLGTGRYFTSAPTSSHPGVHGLSLAGSHLHRPASETSSRELSHGLGILNGIAAGIDDSVEMPDPVTGEPRHFTLDDAIARLPGGTDRENALQFARHAIDAHRDGSPEVASTHLMRALGYDGVDNRHLPALDHPDFGSVVYAPLGREQDHHEASPGVPGHLNVRSYEGEVGNNDHITRVETGSIPVGAVANLPGVRGEVPGEHRNRKGKDWEKFVSDVRENGVREPVFVTVDHGGHPQISEGNHRRDAAVEAGQTHIPAEIRYYGHAEHAGTVLERAGEASPGPEASPGQGGAVVRGVVGRWVWIRGRYTHIPQDRTWRETVDGVTFTSPAGNTNVYRHDGTQEAGAIGDLVSGPGVRARHADVRNPRTGGTARGATIAPPPPTAVETPEEPPEPPAPPEPAKPEGVGAVIDREALLAGQTPHGATMLSVQAEPINATSLPEGYLTVGPIWTRMTGEERQHALDTAYGRALGAAISADDTGRDELSGLWTGGKFTNDAGAHLDRYDAGAAVASAYAQVNGENWRGFAAQYPDASRWVATQAMQRGYFVRPDVAEWAHSPENGNVHNPVGELPPDARSLAASLVGTSMGRVAMDERMRANGYTPSYGPGRSTIYRRVDSEQNHVLTVTVLTDRMGTVTSAEGTAYGFNPNQVPPPGDTPERLAYDLRGMPTNDASRKLDDAGYFPLGSRYSTNRIATDQIGLYVRPDSDVAIRVGFEGQGAASRVTDARPTILSDAEDRSRRVAITATRPDLAMPGMLEGDAIAITGSTRWSRTNLNGSADGPSAGWDLEQITDRQDPNAAKYDAWRVASTRNADGELVVSRVGRPGEEPGSFAADDAEWQRVQSARTAALRATAQDDRARIDATKAIVRQYTNDGAAPNLAGNDRAIVARAMTELGYHAGTERQLQNGTSVTWANRETGTRLSVHYGTDDRAVRTRLLTRGQRDEGRERYPAGSMPPTVGKFNADILGYSDELAARHGVQTDLRRVVYSNDLEDHAGLHRQWDGTLTVGRDVQPALLRAMDAQAGGAPLTDAEKFSAIAAYRTMAHEMLHGVHGERGHDAYVAEDGGVGIEETLTSELEQEHAFALMERHGQAALLDYARSQGFGSRVDYQTYQRHRENFRGLLRDMGLGNATPTALRAHFTIWKLESSPDERRAAFAARIAEHRGLSEQEASDRVVATMNATNAVGNERIGQFVPILRTEVPDSPSVAGRVVTPPPVPVPDEPPPPPVAGGTRVATTALSDGGRVGVGARVHGNSSQQFGTVTQIDGNRITVMRDNGTTGTFGPNDFASVAVTNDGDNLRVGANAYLPNGNQVQIKSVDWTDPQNPMATVKIAGRRTSSIVPARTLTSNGPATPRVILPMVHRDGRAEGAVAGTQVVTASGQRGTLTGSSLSNWPTGTVMYDVRMGDGSVVQMPREGITGFAGELPRAPVVAQAQIPQIHTLQQQHFERADASDTAAPLGAWLGRATGEGFGDWAEVHGINLDGESGENAVRMIYTNAFRSREAYDSIHDQRPRELAGVMQMANEAGLPTPNWEVAVPPGTTNIPPGELIQENVARALFTGTFGRQGYKTSVISARGSERSMQVQGVIKNAQGSQVGNFTRNITKNADGSYSVYNAYMKLNATAQGSGFASAFNRHCFQQYRQRGCREVTVSANLDVGGYTWAATGFDFNVGSRISDPAAAARARAQQAYNMAFSAKQSGRITQAEWDSIRQKLWDGSGALGAQHVQHAWELAHVDGRPGGSRRGEKTIGQKIMLGQHWSGVRLLEPMPGRPGDDSPGVPSA